MFYSQVLQQYFIYTFIIMQEIKWNTPPIRNLRSNKTLNKFTSFCKYSPSRQAGATKKQSQFIQNSRQRVQIMLSTQKNSIDKSSCQKLQSSECNLIKNQQQTCSLKKIKAKFLIRQTAKNDNKVQYKTYIRTILRQIKQIVSNLTEVFRDVDNMLRQLQKTFNFEVQKFHQSNLIQKGLGFTNLHKINSSLKIIQKNQTIKSSPYIKYNQAPQTTKKLSYNSQQKMLQMQGASTKKIQNSCIPTQATEFTTQNCDETNIKSRKNNLLNQQDISPNKRKNSISIQMKKIKGALGQIKRMFNTN